MEQKLIDKARELGYILELDNEGEVIYLYTSLELDFTPEISRKAFRKESEWEIQTTSYGSKHPDVIPLIIEGYQRALKMVELLDLLN